MENFLFLIVFTKEIIIEHNDLEGARKMMTGYNSKCKIFELGHSRKVQNIINELFYEGNDNLGDDINMIKIVYRNEQAGVICI